MMYGEIRNAQGERLDYTAVEGNPANDLVVIGHGVTGNKDREWAVSLATALGRAGWPAMRLSFSGNGGSEGSFRDSTISKEVEDLGSVLDAVAGKADETERGVVYVGHSMGGAVGVLRAARDHRIRRLVSLAGMVETEAFAERKFGDLVPDRDLMWDKPECPLSSAFMEDMRAIGSTLPVAATVKVQWLLVHGTADEVVPLDDSRRAQEAAGETARLIELPGVDHVFSGEGTGVMVEHVVAWVNGRNRFP